jgi:hypothetical protein
MFQINTFMSQNNYQAAAYEYLSMASQIKEAIDFNDYL